MRFDLSNLPLPYKDKQKAYEAQRAALRPEIHRLYGHLAKAEKTEPSEEKIDEEEK